ncbi:hypothetical protein K2X14_14610 [Acetobacter sp. TBRC 12305]|uniref:Uncharacterized protein n=1 Tax=Acetobacter garciniae TaxID=2817435 RepID=A0A939HKQ3_9PROT|nr:hypothetical protein [Acetobacter garciniae]MBO1326195.1 hypothetical protein [Acetobacter garciniae]MBX0346068.1 hypothetical protein [Acetobacter garciniae]
MSESESTVLPSDLYDILDLCTNEELSPIVETLEKSPVSILKITRAFERNAPNHQSYADQIGDEAYRLALMALGRSTSTRPSYAEMLAGFCKQIGFSAKLTDISEDEATLINLFSTQYMSFSLSSGNTQQIMNEASAAAAAAVRGILSSDAWPPFASILLQIIYLRHKLMDDGRISCPEAEIQKNSKQADQAASSIVIQTEDGEPVLALATLPDDKTSEWQDLKSNLGLQNALIPLLKAAQPFMSTEQMLADGNYCHAEMALSYSKKLGHYVGTSKGHSGMVRLDPASVTKLASPTAMLTLACALAEQKKLQNIEKSLDEIKASIKDVAAFQQNERRSVITASIRYLQQIASSVLAGELADEILQEIERHEVDLVRVQEHLTSDLNTQIAAFRTVKKEGWGSGKYTTALAESQGTLESIWNDLLLCIRARACGYQLLCAFPEREARKKTRLQDIINSLSSFSPESEVGSLFDQTLREKLQIISANDTKAFFVQREQTLFKNFSAQTKNIVQNLDSSAKEISERDELLQIDIKMQDGTPVAFRMA